MNDTKQNQPSPKPPAWSQARLAALRYMPRTFDTETHDVMRLSNKSSVRRSTFELAWKLFWSNAYRLDPNRKHPVEALCSCAGWGTFSITQHRNIGRCIRYLAENGVLPITLAHKYYPLAYLLNNDLGVDPLSL